MISWINKKNSLINSGGGRRNSALDGIKGCCALLIAAVYHLATISYPYSSGLPLEGNKLISWVYQNGYLLVEMFFLISGYLAFSVYTKRIENGCQYSEFAIRRIKRIFPLMLGTLLTSTIGTLLYYLTHNHTYWVGGTDSVLTLGLSLFGLQSLLPIGQSWNYPAWSLSVFFLCWTIYYMIIRFTKNKKALRIYLCIALILIGLTIQLTPIEHVILLWNFDSSRGYIGFFCGGIIYYIHSLENDKLKKKIGYGCILWLIVCFSLLSLGIPLGPPFAAYTLVIFAPLLISILEIKIFNRFFSAACFRYLGKISFAIYLGNYTLEIFLFLVNEYLGLNIQFSSGLFLLCYIGLNIINGSIFYWLFESKRQIGSFRT